MYRSPLKRKDGFENDDARNKRRRLESPKNNKSSKEEYFDPKKPANFVKYHFNLLRSLYESDTKEKAKASPEGSNDSLQANDEGSANGRDDPIPEKTWSTIERFLGERVKILKSKQEASSWSAVHREALGGCDAETTTGSNVVVSGDASFHHRPFSQRSATSPPAKDHKIASTAAAAAATTSGSFSIVARLLGQHAAAVDSQFQEQAAVYQTLSGFVQQRTNCLRKKLKSLQQTKDEEDRKRMGDLMNADAVAAAHDRPATEQASDETDEVSQFLALQAKLQLWGLLAADLKDIV